MDESHVETEDVEVVRRPRWITSVGCLRYSDLFASGKTPKHRPPSTSFFLRLLLGSWDGEIRLWKLDSKLRSFSLIGSIAALGVVNTLQFISIAQDVAESFSWASSTSEDDAESPRQVNGKSTSSGRKSLLLVAGVGQEMRFGRWVQKKGEGVLNGALVTLLHTRTSNLHP